MFRIRTRQRVLIAAVIFAQALSTGARAEVKVTGESDAIKLEAKEASVEELLTALNKAYGLQFRSSANLSQSVSGAFAGSLQQVVYRVLVLEGYNFICETSEHGTIVAVYDKTGEPGSDVNLGASKPAPPAPMAAAAAPRAPLPPPMAAPLPPGDRDPRGTNQFWQAVKRRPHQF
ncbi:MAG TPA: hypothetical protein VLZ74_13275 [Methylocella sp.]|nr:hypothetical protein [Methylocella sp.]